MRKFTILLFVSFLLASAISAQKVTGVILDQQGKGLEKSTVSLLKAKDSAVVKLAVTGGDGRFSFSAEPGDYLVNVTHVGYTPVYSKKIEVSGSGSVEVGNIEMAKVSANLQGVTVTAQRPIVEVRADKMIAPTNIDLYSVKTDYERNFKGGRLGIGGKIAFVNTDNDFQRYNVYSNGKVMDTLKSNRFDYKENINAIYVNYNKANIA